MKTNKETNRTSHGKQIEQNIEKTLTTCLNHLEDIHKRNQNGPAQW
jgi:hypothetical protein